MTDEKRLEFPKTVDCAGMILEYQREDSGFAHYHSEEQDFAVWAEWRDGKVFSAAIPHFGWAGVPEELRNIELIPHICCKAAVIAPDKNYDRLFENLISIEMPDGHKAELTHEERMGKLVGEVLCLKMFDPVMTHENVGKVIGKLLSRPGVSVMVMEDVSHVEDPDDLPDPYENKPYRIELGGVIMPKPDPYESPAIEFEAEFVPAPALPPIFENIMLSDRVSVLEKELPYLREKSALLETMLKKKDQTLAGVIEKMEEANRQVSLYAGRDKYLCDRIEAYEAIIEQERKFARVWKRCAKNKHVLIESWDWVTDAFKVRAEKAEAERDALKCCGNCAEYSRSSADGYSCGVDGEPADPDYVCDKWKAGAK